MKYVIWNADTHTHRRYAHLILWCVYKHMALTQIQQFNIATEREPLKRTDASMRMCDCLVCFW